jgi:hypothetical protein
MPSHALLSPIQGFALLQLLLWPWICAQAQAPMETACRRPGLNVYARWHVTPLGHVYIADTLFLVYETDGVHLQTAAGSSVRLTAIDAARLMRVFKFIEAQLRYALCAGRFARLAAHKFRPMATAMHTPRDARRLDSS